MAEASKHNSHVTVQEPTPSSENQKLLSKKFSRRTLLAGAAFGAAIAATKTPVGERIGTGLTGVYQKDIDVLQQVKNDPNALLSHGETPGNSTRTQQEIDESEKEQRIAEQIVRKWLKPDILAKGLADFDSSLDTTHSTSTLVQPGADDLQYVSSFTVGQKKEAQLHVISQYHRGELQGHFIHMDLTRYKEILPELSDMETLIVTDQKTENILSDDALVKIPALLFNLPPSVHTDETAPGAHEITLQADTEKREHVSIHVNNQEQVELLISAPQSAK